MRRRSRQLFALAADPHPYPERDPPVPEHEHEQHSRERRLPLHRSEQRICPAITRASRDWTEPSAPTNYTGAGSARRRNVGADYRHDLAARPRQSASLTRSTTPMSVMPGTATFSGVSQSIPAAAIAAKQETINYAGVLTPGAVAIVGQAPIGLPLPNYLGTEDSDQQRDCDLGHHSPRHARTHLSLRARFVGQKVQPTLEPPPRSRSRSPTSTSIPMAASSTSPCARPIIGPSTVPSRPITPTTPSRQ